MKLFKYEKGSCVDGCPYYQSPPLDFPKEQQYHRCQPNYYANLELNKVKEQCPMTNIESVLEEFMKYIRKHNYDFNEIMDLQLSNKLIHKFLEEEIP